MSVAVAVQVMVLPIGCGEAGDGLKVVTVTAKAGAANAATSPLRNGRILFGIFMRFLPMLNEVTARLRGTKAQQFSHGLVFSID